MFSTTRSGMFSTTRNGSMRAVRRAATLSSLLFVVAALVGGTAESAAPKMCIADAAGVPGSPGTPDWFTPGQVTNTNQPNRIAYQPMDPRWLGAMTLDFGSGSISEVEYRALHTQSGQQRFLLLSWQIKSIAQFGVDQTRLYAGFYNQAANSGALITVILKNTATGEEPGMFFPPGTPVARSSADTVGGSPYFEVVLTTGTGTDPATWTSPAATPGWLTSSLRTWINAQVNPYKWTVQVRVPLSANIADGIDLQPASFRMWHYAQVEALLSGSAPPAIVPYTWPRPDPGQPALTYASFLQGIQQVYPPAIDPNVADGDTSWGEFALVANPAADATCGGIYLTTDRIGTRATPFSSQIKLDANNTFFAEPHNRAGAIGNNIMSATFKIANWGSQVGDTQAASWTAPAALTNVPSGPVAANAFGNIEGQWNPSANLADICPFIGQSGGAGVPGNPACPNVNPTRLSHQCIMVELQGPGLNFVRDSAFRNMDFVKASTFEREAEISVVGLDAMPAGQRDVFLYVERRNMPRYPTKVGEPGEEPGEQPQDPPGADVNRIDAVLAGRLRHSDEDIANLMPTWIVHAYHDTGERIRLSSGEHTVLQPQNAFGYFVQHEGAFNGWADVIEGADRLREDLYKVAPQNDGAVRVKTIVQAVEGNEPPVGQWPPVEPPKDSRLWLWILLALILLAVIIFALRRARNP